MCVQGEEPQTKELAMQLIQRDDITAILTEAAQIVLDSTESLPTPSLLRAPYLRLLHGLFFSRNAHAAFFCFACLRSFLLQDFGCVKVIVMCDQTE